MNPNQSPPPPAAQLPAGVAPEPVRPATTEQLARLKRVTPPAQRRMEAKQSAEGGANHARHHTSRKTQS